jgi:Yip1 domain
VNLTIQSLTALTRLTLTEPRRAARAVIGMDLAAPIIWIGVALTSVLAALLVHASLLTLPVEDAELAAIIPGPFQTAAMQFAMLVIAAAAATVVGQMREGTGRFFEALSLMVWLQAVMLLVQVAQIVVLLTLPMQINTFLGFAGIGLFLWLLTNFVAELHGFRSLGRVFLGVIGVIVALVIALSLVIAPFYPVGG